ncbi:MAG: YkvA family protein [Thainema sp.]
MLSRTPSGQVIGSTKPKTHVVDPTCWPSVQATRQASSPALDQTAGKQQPGAYTLEALPAFPRTLFDVKKYDGARALTALLLLLATIYFSFGFLVFLVDHNPWLKDIFHQSAIANMTAKAEWWQVWKVVGRTASQIASYVDLAFRLFVFLCAYCLAWATFDPRNIEGYVMGFFNACLGLAYMISPVDVIPDFVPIAGSLDDTVLGFGVLFLGLSSLYRNKLRDVKTKTIVELIDDGNNQKALQMLLEDKGITIKQTSSDLRQPE